MASTRYGIDTSSWTRLRVSGADRVRFLHSLTTINLHTLTPGQPAWGCILNPKGRVLSVLAAMCDGPVDTTAALDLWCDGAFGANTQLLLERYAVMDDVVFERSQPGSHRPIACPHEVWTAPFTLGPAPANPLALDDPRAQALRLAAGFPRYGVDVSDDQFPFETPLGQFLDYGKGCYVGQEPVFRVHAQGNAAKTLRGLRCAAPVAVGAAVAHADRANAGTVTSALSTLDTPWGVHALAYLHRSVWAPGGHVKVGDIDAIVVDVPVADAPGEAARA